MLVDDSENVTPQNNLNLGDTDRMNTLIMAKILLNAGS